MGRTSCMCVCIRSLYTTLSFLIYLSRRRGGKRQILYCGGYRTVKWVAWGVTVVIIELFDSLKPPGRCGGAGAGGILPILGKDCQSFCLRQQVLLLAVNVLHCSHVILTNSLWVKCLKGRDLLWERKLRSSSSYKDLLVHGISFETRKQPVPVPEKTQNYYGSREISRIVSRWGRTPCSHYDKECQPPKHLVIQTGKKNNGCNRQPFNSREDYFSFADLFFLLHISPNWQTIPWSR